MRWPQVRLLLPAHRFPRDRARGAGVPVDHRDEKTVAAVACSFCGAPRGAWCVRYPGSRQEIESVHFERRETWQTVRGPVQQAPTRLCPDCGHGAGQHGSRGCRKCDCTRTKAEARG